MQLIAIDLAAAVADVQINFHVVDTSFALAPAAGGVASGSAKLIASIKNDGSSATLLTLAEDAEKPGGERQLLDAAIEKARGQRAALQAQLQAGHDPAKAAIFAAHTKLLDDPDLLDVAASCISNSVRG